MEALEDLPYWVKHKIENLAVVIDEESAPAFSRPLLGLYQGVPVSERGTQYSGAIPDKIALYKQAIEEMCRTEEEVKIVVRETVIHEFAHYFGFSEKKIRDAGY